MFEIGINEVETCNLFGESSSVGWGVALEVERWLFKFKNIDSYVIAGSVAHV